jgi:hypothetical protein
MTTDTTQTPSGTDSVNEPSAVAPIALTAGEGEALWFLGILATIKSSSESTAGRVAVIEHLAPRASGSPLHPRDCSCTDSGRSRTRSSSAPSRRGSCSRSSAPRHPHLTAASRRYAEEGARRDEHPMITFRGGPTGRRAGLIGGPDVWEVAMWIEDLGSTKDPGAELAADGVVSRPQVDAVVAYRAAYPDEVQARIELYRSETAAEAR